METHEDVIEWLEKVYKPEYTYNTWDNFPSPPAVKRCVKSTVAKTNWLLRTPPG